MDDRLNDRFTPFSAKLSIATDLLATHPHLVGDLLDWLLLSLTKMSRVLQPRPDVFLNEDAWRLLSKLLSHAFPEDQPYLFSDMRMRVKRVRCRQPLLPALTCYLKLASDQLFAEYVYAVKTVMQAYKNELIEAHWQWSQLIEYCQLAQGRDKLLECALEMLAKFLEDDPRRLKKHLDKLQSTLPEICTEGSLAGDRLLLMAYGSDPIACKRHIDRLTSPLIVRFFQLYLESKQSMDREQSFLVFQDLIRVSQLNAEDIAQMITLLDKHHVYVHKNDAVYQGQSIFLRKLLLDQTNPVVFCACLSLDYYMVIDVLPQLSPTLLYGSLGRLFEMGVKAKQVDVIIKGLRAIGMHVDDKHAVYCQLAKLPIELLRHYEQEASDQLDGHWELLAHLAQLDLERLEERLRRIEDEEMRERLLLYYHHTQVAWKKHELNNVPNMDPQDFSTLLPTLSSAEVREMLKVPLFYELSALQEPFESWLLSRENAGDLLTLVPPQYLSDRTVMKLRHIPESVKIFKKRPQLIKKLFKRHITDEEHLIPWMAKFAVGNKKDKYIRQLMSVNRMDAILSVKPINPVHASLVCSQCDGKNTAYIPYLLSSGQEERARELYHDSPNARKEFPYVFGLPPTHHSQLRHYSEDMQRAYVSGQANVDIHLLSLLQDKATRSIALEHMCKNPAIPLSVCKVLVGMVKTDMPVGLVLSSLNTGEVEDRLSCLSLLAKHRPQLITSPQWIAMYFGLVFDVLSSPLEPLQQHDIVRLVQNLTRIKHRLILHQTLLTEALCVLTVSLARVSTPILEEGIRLLKRRLGRTRKRGVMERLLVMCPDDMIRSRLRNVPHL